MPVSALLFDIGNVIIHFDFARTVSVVRGQCHALPAATLLEMVTNPIIELELGKIEPGKFVSDICRRIGFSGTEEEFLAAFEDVFDLNLPMAHFIEKQSAAGIPLYLLSNTNAIHVPFFTKRYPVFSHFSGAVYSHEEHCMKPDPKIYQIVTESFSLTPNETIYIDDSPVNCQAGRVHGFETVCYDRKNHEDFLRSIDRLLQ